MKNLSYPKNSVYFKRLIPFAQRILRICEENNIPTLIYGSFAHFYHTQDKNMKVNDIDIMIADHKKNFPKLFKLLKNERLKVEYYPKWETCIIRKGSLRVEVDSVGDGYIKSIGDPFLENGHDKVEFYGVQVRVQKLSHLEKAYPRAYFRSTDNKDKILKKIKRLEEFLGRKLKGNLTIDRIKSKDLNSKDKMTLEKLRVKEFGKENYKDFKKDYEPNTLWVIVRNKGKIVSFGGIRTIRVKYLGKIYSIGGVCSTISTVKRKGYGSIMASFMRNYSYKTGKTIIGFTGKTEFFAKCSFGVKKDFIRRFVWVKKNGEKVYDSDGDGVYYEGKDKLVSKVLKGKGMVEIPMEFW